jgi:hypothetical protein
MIKQLMFVHGRAQEKKDAAALKGEWIAAFREGLSKSGLDLSISENMIRFPYYGQTLYDLVSNVPPEKVAQVIVKGENADEQQRAFVRAVIQEVRDKAGITDAEIAAVAGQAVVTKGPLNWEWLHAVLRAIEQTVPGASGAAIAVATNDVYQYLFNIGIRDAIEEGIRKAMQPDADTVIVGHSLGTVVAYSLLRREGKSSGWKVPLYVTLGCPLGVSAIKRALAPNRHPECVGDWFNALDVRDIVALYPLDEDTFPITPSIENKIDVNNQTENRHGISGYLNDKEVAKRIYDELVR